MNAHDLDFNVNVARLVKAAQIQGFPAKIEDPLAVRKVATILRTVTNPERGAA
jgi:hypothetical protein